MTDYSKQHRLLDSLVHENVAGTIRDLTSYFDGSSYTGAYYDVSRHNGNIETSPDAFTAADIGAVAMLSVDVPPSTTLAILGSRHGDLSGPLSTVTNSSMWEVPFDELADESAAVKVWSTLEAIPGSGWVTAGKLLARKRPHLIPIYDTVTRAELGHPKGFWRCLWEYFRADESRVDTWRSLQSEVPRLDDISVLRRIDVALWMRGTGER